MATQNIAHTSFPAASPVIFQHTNGDDGLKGNDTLLAALKDLICKLWNGYAVVRIFERQLVVAKRNSEIKTEYVALPADIVVMAALAGFLKRLWFHKQIVDPEIVPMIEGLLSEAGFCIIVIDDDHVMPCRLPDEIAKLERLSLLLAVGIKNPKIIDQIFDAKHTDKFYDNSAALFAQNPNSGTGKTIGTVGAKR